MGVIIDISRWQYDIDFAQLSELYKTGKIDGVMIRVQHGYTHLDENYTKNVAGCKQYGIPFGTYAYGAFVSINDAIAEADCAFTHTDSESKCFALDIEEETMTDLVSGGQAYIDRLKARGTKNVGIYSGEYFYKSHNLGAINCDWTWIANYGVNGGQPHTPPSVAGVDLWQFTSTAHMNGINTDVDESQIVDPNGFPFFKRQVVEPPKIIMHVKALCKSDIRSAPSHTAGYIRDTQPGELFDVYQIVNKDGTQWHLVGGTPGQETWIDGNNGQNLFWIDNPNLVSQPVNHTIVSGDTVGALAKQFGSTIDEIKAWNNLDSNYTIYVGKSIRVK